ncbi:MAG: DNA repair protein RadA, partial [Mucinivorans sp.]
MAKVKKAFFCNSCGAESPQWFGRCTVCGQWNSCSEEVISAAPSKAKSLGLSSSFRGVSSPAVAIQNVVHSAVNRIDLGSGELNRV